MTQVLNFHDAVIYDSDVKLFANGGWLSDNCINCVFRTLEYDVFPGRKEFLFMDPAVVSCLMYQCDEPEEVLELGRGIEIDTRTVVFVPINDAGDIMSSGSHWSLLVFERGRHGVKSSRFRHYDSALGSNRHAAETTAAKFLHMFDGVGATDAPVVDHVKDSPQQKNGFDCGMYTVVTAEKLAAHYARTGTSGATVMPTHDAAEALATIEREAGCDRGTDLASGTSGIGAGLSTCASGSAASGADFDMTSITPAFVSNARDAAMKRLQLCIGG